MQEYFVDTPEQLTELARQLADSEWLALDTEFIRERTYHPRLCLIQVSNGDVAACVDPLAITDMTPLLDVLFDGRILKVFHAARQDLEIFLHDWGQIPLPLFDTQPSAALLGYGDQIGYARLVKQLLNVDLPKDHTRTDWTRRPLSKEQIRYALDDVVYLGDLYLKLRGQLSDRDRLQWLAEDFSELANPNTYVQNPETTWKRVKGHQHLRGMKLAVLQKLAAWREERALQRDLPRKWILKDEVLVDISRRMPKDIHQLSGIRGLEPSAIRRDGEEILQRVETARKLPKDEWPVDARPAQDKTPQQDAMTDLLSCALRLIASKHQLSPSAIANRKEIEKLVRGEEDSELMHGWRRVVAGDLLLEVQSGKRLIINQDGELLLGQHKN